MRLLAPFARSPPYPVLFDDSFDATRNNVRKEEDRPMPTRYVRIFSLKDSLSDGEVVAYWRFLLDEFAPVTQKVKGVQSVKFYSGAGALRADCSIVADLDDAAVYERILVDPDVRKLLGRFYGALDLKASSQQFRREVTPVLISALSST